MTIGVTDEMYEMEVLITEYIDLMDELEWMKSSCQMLTAITKHGNVVIPSFEQIMRVEKIQDRLNTMYMMMLEMGIQISQERVDDCVLRLFVYRQQ